MTQNNAGALVGKLIITGTSTGVGKTIVTAAIASVAQAQGQTVRVVKPVQTGVTPTEPGDLADVQALTGITNCTELYRFGPPLAPEAAARVSGQSQPLPEMLVQGCAGDEELILIEGAGGLLVRLNSASYTLADLAQDLSAPVLIVATAGLGTLNHVALTAAALAQRNIVNMGVVIGSWPQDPDLACRQNLIDLPQIAGPLLGLLPAGAGALTPEDFLVAARGGLSPELGGNFQLSKGNIT